MQHDGRTNKYPFIHFDQRITLSPLSPNDVRKYQKQMKEKYEQEKENEKKENEKEKEEKNVGRYWPLGFFF